MKILYVVHQFFPFFHTGSERLTFDTAKQMQKMGHSVTILTYEPNHEIENPPDEFLKFVNLDYLVIFWSFLYK